MILNELGYSNLSTFVSRKGGSHPSTDRATTKDHFYDGLIDYNIDMSGLDQYGQYEDDDPGMMINDAVICIIYPKCVA